MRAAGGLATGCLLALSGCSTDVPLQETDSASDGAAYAALGDSYSAGEGTNSYLPGTDVIGTNVCHRSALAYSQLIARQLGTASDAFVACSGAVTADMFQPNNNGNLGPDGRAEPAELCQLELTAGISPCTFSRPSALGPGTKIVTLTIGGNDAGFAKVLESCLFSNDGRYRVGLPGRGCRDDPATIARTVRRIAALAGDGQDTSPYSSAIQSISSVLEAIHTVAPHAQVYIAGYPHVLEPPSADDCVVGAVTGGATTSIPLKVTAADARAVDNAIQSLNTTIRFAAQSAGAWATYVDPVATFEGHGLCTSTSWINPIEAAVSFDASGRSIKVTPNSGSGHPTAEGQDAGYAAAFLRAGVAAKQ